MMTFEGEFYLDTDVSKTMKFLRDIVSLLPCIPNVLSYDILSDEMASVRFRIDVSSAGIEYLSKITSRLDIRVIKVDDSSIKYEGKGRIAGTGYSVTISLNLRDDGGRTHVFWKAEAELGKALTLLGKFIDVNKMVEEIASQTVTKLVECVERGL